MKKCGWFSPTAFKKNDISHVYAKPDGEEVTVTVIGDSPTVPPSSFGDEVLVGKVTYWIRNIENPNSDIFRIDGYKEKSWTF